MHRSYWLMSLSLGLACATRYEAWFVALFLAVLELHRSGLGAKQLLRVTLLFGWAPLVWVAVHGGFAPSGTYVADTDWSWTKWERVPYLAGRIVAHAPYALVLVPLGFVTRGQDRERWPPRALWALGAIALVTCAIILAGHAYPPGTSLVSERAAHFPMVGIVLVSAWVLGSLTPGSKVQPLLLFLSLAGSVALSQRHVEARASTAEVSFIHSVARYIDTSLPSNEMILVAGKPVDPALIDHYLDLIARRKPEELEAARRLVQELTLPESYQRLVVSLPRGRERLIAASRWRGEPIARVLVLDGAFDHVPEEVSLAGEWERVAIENGEVAWLAVNAER